MIQRLIFSAIFVLFGVLSSKAQQDPLYGLYLNNPIMINPAYTGLNNNFNATAGFRSQWAGFDGSPTTLSLSAHSSLLQNKMGAGLIIVNDKIGESTTTQITATYAYKIEVAQDHLLSFGMQAGVMNYKLDPGKLNLQDPSDPAFSSLSTVKPTLGAGVMLKSEKYLLGISVPRLLSNSYQIGGQTTSLYQQHFYLFGSYIFSMSERIQLKPSVLIKAVKGSPMSVDVNFNVNIDRNYTVGAYTRNLNSYGLLAQINFLEHYRLAYALEVPTNHSVGTRYTTNELNLGIKLSVLKFHNRSITNF
jgi:type IX secretion system PorP/SprF family membrane protein